MAFKQLWFWKASQLTDKWSEVYAFATDEHDRPSTLSLCGKPTNAEPVWFGSIDAEENLFINWRDKDVMGVVPPLWYVVKDAPRPHPNGPDIPMMFIYALYGDDFPSGTIVLEEDLIKNKFVGHSERVGFLQWFKQDSKIQQIFVEEKWRRKRVTLALFGVADLVIVAGNYGPYLNGGDVTTNDGETLRSAWAGSKRVIERKGSVGGMGGI